MDSRRELVLKGDDRWYSADWSIFPNESDTRLMLQCNGEYAIELSPESVTDLIEYLTKWRNRTYKAGSK